MGVTSCCVSRPTGHWCTSHGNHQIYHLALCRRQTSYRARHNDAHSRAEEVSVASSVTAPTTNHFTSCNSTSQAGTSELSSHDPFLQKEALSDSWGFTKHGVMRTPSSHRGFQLATGLNNHAASHHLDVMGRSHAHCTFVRAQQSADVKCEQDQFNGMDASLCCYECQQCTCVVNDCHECVPSPLG